jgi:hypothetical protein
VSFTVTVTNAAGHGYSDLGPLVSLSHCACTRSSLFPAGTLQERSPDGSWQNISYDIEGFGTDFRYVTQQPGIQLGAGTSESFGYRIALSPATSAQVTRGTAEVDVTLEELPAHTPIGRYPEHQRPDPGAVRSAATVSVRDASGPRDASCRHRGRDRSGSPVVGCSVGSSDGAVIRAGCRGGRCSCVRRGWSTGRCRGRVG